MTFPVLPSCLTLKVASSGSERVKNGPQRSKLVFLNGFLQIQANNVFGANLLIICLTKIFEVIFALTEKMPTPPNLDYTTTISELDHPVQWYIKFVKGHVVFIK